MNRKWIYTFSLIGFFLLWGVFGLPVGSSHHDQVIQVTPAAQEGTVLDSGATKRAAIPITGDPTMETEVLLTYVFFGLIALLIILALLNAANTPPTPDSRPIEPPDGSS